MSGSQQSSPGDHRQNGGQNSQGPGYHYEYNYNYNFNAGPTPPPRKNGLGDWIGIIVLLLIPTGITQIIAVIWALRKVAGMSRQQRRYYYNQYRRTAERIRREVEDVFRDNRSSGFSDQRYDSRAGGAGYASAATKHGPSPGPRRNPGSRPRLPRNPGSGQTGREIPLRRPRGRAAPPKPIRPSGAPES